MMRKDNPPAFPHLSPNYDGNWDNEPQRCGMSLRDWFAGQALAEFASLIAVDRPDTMNVVARLSYNMADAMLAARQSGDPS